MNRTIILIIALLFLVPVSASAADKSSDFKQEVSDTVVGTVDATKDFFSGVMDGLENATKDDSKVTQSHTVGSKADLARLLKVEITKIENKENGHYLLTVALRNNNEFPVKVTGLKVLGNVVLLDKDGFSYPLPNREQQGHDVTALARSATRLRLTFTGVEARPTLFRLFNTDFGLPLW